VIPSPSMRHATAALASGAGSVAHAGIVAADLRSATVWMTGKTGGRSGVVPPAPFEAGDFSFWANALGFRSNRNRNCGHAEKNRKQEYPHKALPFIGPELWRWSGQEIKPHGKSGMADEIGFASPIAPLRPSATPKWLALRVRASMSGPSVTCWDCGVIWISPQDKGESVSACKIRLFKTAVSRIPQ